MKKYILILAIVSYAIHSQAAVILKTDTVKKDSAKMSKQEADLTSKLSELKVKLINAQNQIPIDSGKMVEATSKSQNLLSDSKNSAGNAVGGDLSDAKKAEKMAKKAANASGDARDASKKLDKDRKKVQSLMKDIAKTQEKLDKLQAPPTQ